MKDAMIRILRGALRIFSVMYAITVVFFGISYLGFASQNDLDTFWKIGWVAWAFLAPWFALGLAMILGMFWAIGDNTPKTGGRNRRNSGKW